MPDWNPSGSSSLQPPSLPTCCGGADAINRQPCLSGPTGPAAARRTANQVQDGLPSTFAMKSTFAMSLRRSATAAQIYHSRAVRSASSGHRTAEPNGGSALSRKVARHAS